MLYCLALCTCSFEALFEAKVDPLDLLNVFTGTPVIFKVEPLNHTDSSMTNSGRFQLCCSGEHHLFPAAGVWVASFSSH